MPTPQRSCPVLAGPTAAGKTALIVAVARRHPIEVISLDSRQIYAGLRIGTAQPTEEEQAACRHHLIDFVPPTETYTAARFRADFIKAYEDIRARRAIPILVGGAGLYLSAVEKGLFDLPGLDPQTTAQLREQLSGLPTEEIRAQLQARDPASHARIHPADRYRSQRALEICLATGRTMTEQMEAHDQHPDPALGLSFPLVWVTRDRADLHARIAARTQSMLAAGWMEETAALLAQHGPHARGLRAIGYRELVAHLQGELGEQELEPRITAATRQYAKRQETWFRPLPKAAEGHPDDPTLAAALAGLLTAAAAT
ncbi:MAG: tRNA (adenosine(37)-N6)-dimethylallyltransferase MiaA [Candidatus Krumholzibacteriia bacterium]